MNDVDPALPLSVLCLLGISLRAHLTVTTRAAKVF